MNAARQTPGARVSDPTARPLEKPRRPGPVVRPHLVPVPDSLPPYDDARAAMSRLRALAASQKAARMLRAGMPSTPQTVSAQDVPAWSQDPDIGVCRTTTADLPAAHRAGHTMARGLVEVLFGRRPLDQLRVHCAPDVFAGLQQAVVSRSVPGRLASVRVSQPADGVAEIAAVFKTPNRAGAIAFRIQGVDGRWRVTALQTG